MLSSIGKLYTTKTTSTTKKPEHWLLFYSDGMICTVRQTLLLCLAHRISVQHKNIHRKQQLKLFLANNPFHISHSRSLSLAPQNKIEMVLHTLTHCMAYVVAVCLDVFVCVYNPKWIKWINFQYHYYISIASYLLLNNVCTGYVAVCKRGAKKKKGIDEASERIKIDDDEGDI